MAYTDDLLSQKVELLVLTDNAAFARKFIHFDSRWIVSTSQQALSELQAAGVKQVFDIGIFSKWHFSDWDALCDHYRPLIVKSLCPDDQPSGRKAFESVLSGHVNFWAQVYYFDEVVSEIRRLSNPSGIEVGIQYNDSLRTILLGLTRSL